MWVSVSILLEIDWASLIYTLTSFIKFGSFQSLFLWITFLPPSPCSTPMMHLLLYLMFFWSPLDCVRFLHAFFFNFCSSRLDHFNCSVLSSWVLCSACSCALLNPLARLSFRVVYIWALDCLVSLQVFHFLLITSFHWYVVFLASFNLCAFFLCLIEHILDGCFKSLSTGFLGSSLYQDFCSFGLTYFLYFFVHCHFLVETWTFDCYDVVTLEIRLFFPSIWFVFICFYCGRLS